MMESPYQDMSKKEILEEYTEVMRNISEHIKNFPERTESSIWEVYSIWEVEPWLDQLKILVGEEQ